MTINRDSWRRVLIDPDYSVISAIEKINKEALGGLLVIDKNNVLLGVVTDGDVRRHLLRHGKLEAPVSDIMNKNPKIAHEGETREQLLIRMQNLTILHCLFMV